MALSLPLAGAAPNTLAHTEVPSGSKPRSSLHPLARSLTATSCSFSSRAVIADPCSPSLAHLLFSFSQASLPAPLLLHLALSSSGPPCFARLLPLVSVSSDGCRGIYRSGQQNTKNKETKTLHA